MKETRTDAPPSRSVGLRRAFKVLRPFTAMAIAVMLCTPPALTEEAPPGRLLNVIDREDIELSGHRNLRDLLQSRSAFNSFGLFGARFGTGAAVHLINGRDIVGVDFDSIPLSSIERIEILDQGPVRNSAWGIGVAVNIVLRNDLDKFEISTGVGLPTQTGRDERNVDVLWGGAIGRGRLKLSFSRTGRQEVLDRDRDYLASDWTSGGSFVDSTGVSIGGNTLIFVPAGSTNSQYASLGACSPGAYTGVLTHPLGEVCGYPYAEVSWVDGSHRFSRDSLFVAADHPLGDDAEVYLEARVSRGETLNRWAPAVGFFSFAPTGDVRENIIANVEGLDDTNFPDDGRVTVGHRFVGNGNREWNGDTNENGILIGIQGILDSGLSYDLRAEYYRNRVITTGINFVSESLARAAIESGEYDVANPLSPADPAQHGHAIREIAVREVQDEDDEYRKIDAVLEGKAFALAGGPVRWTLGVEVEDWNHKSVYDRRDSHGRQVELDDVLGTGGTSLAATRNYAAAMAESTLPLNDRWDLTLGARQDTYSDVGDAVSLHAASNYRLNNALTFRSSWGRAARPPSLGDLHSPEFTSFPHVCDPLNTDASGRPVCTQYDMLVGGNPDLKPSTTERLAVGVAASVGTYSLSADWFSVDSTDLPGSVSAQTVVDRAAAGNPVTGTRVERTGQHIDRIVNPTVQEGEAKTRGIVLHGGAEWETKWADLSFDVRAIRTTRDELHVLNVRIPYDYPRDRAHAVLQASRGDFGASWNTHYVSSYLNRSEQGRYDAWHGHDVAVQWRDAFGVGLVLTGGVLNIADRSPSVDSSGEQRPDLTVDGVRGRTFFINTAVSW